MSDANDNEKQPAASCGRPSSSSPSSDYLDLTLELSDAEEAAASSPSPTTKTGSLKDFGKYAKSLRKRNNPPIGKEDGEDIIPNLVSPPPKRKKKKETTKSLTSSDSSDIVDYGGIPVGNEGYKFHNTFYVGGKGKIKTTAVFHGEVIYIRDLTGASGGKNRRCAYNDGDSHDLSLVDLCKLSPCKDKNCTLQSSSTKIEEYVNKHRPRGGILKSFSAFLKDDGDDDETEEKEHDGLAVGKSSEEDESGEDVVLPKGRNTKIAKTNTRLFESDDDNSSLDTPDDGRKKSPPPDSDEESLFGSDSDESLQGKNSDDENKKDSPSQLHDGNSADSDEKSLFSSDDDGGEEVINDQQASGNANSEDGGDDSSRFSNDPFGMFDQQQQRPPKRVVVEQKRKIIAAPSMVKTYNIPPEMRIEPTYYYFADLWGDRMIKRCTPLGDGPPPETLPATSPGGVCYEILFSEVVSRKGKGFAEDKMGQKYYSSYYLGVSGGGLKKINIKSALKSIGDFEALTYEKGPHKTLSRLKLLVSPTCHPPGSSNGTFCFHHLDSNHFEVIDDNGHLGCGYIHPEFRCKLLGQSKPAQRVMAMHVRGFGPDSVGVFKGMLVDKEEGIEKYKIQIPTSMVKVNKSKTRPLHKYVALSIRRTYPSNVQWCMGKLLNDDVKDPTEKQLNEIKAPAPDVMKVLECNGVDKCILDEYMQDYKHNRKFRFQGIEHAKARIKHGNFVGVSDPTGCIPPGCIFLTGFTSPPPTVFITRFPCTEAQDGIVLPVASWTDIMNAQAFQFLESLSHGAVVFPLGSSPLPPMIQDGDLDGDLYACIWEESLIGGIPVHDGISGTADPIDLNSMESVEKVDDEILNEEFQHEMNGKMYDARVKEKIGEKYHVSLKAVKSNTAGPKKQTVIEIEMTRDEIIQGKDHLVEITTHRCSKGAVDFKCRWNSGEINMISSSNLKAIHSGPPQALVEYVLDKNLHKSGVLPKTFCKWIEEDIVEANVVEVIDHKTNPRGKIEVLVRYDDGSEDWQTLKDAKNDCKLFLAAYAKNKNLGWKGLDGFWWEEVKELMCKNKRSHEISNLLAALHKAWTDKFDELGGTNSDVIRLGRAYKKSLDIEKHGGLLKLPYDLYQQLPKKLQKFVEIM